MNVEIEIPIAELKSKLPGLAKIVPRSSNLPILQCIKVSLQQNSIALQAHNLDEIATVTLPDQANGLSGELLVPMEMLTKVVKGCASDQSVRLISNKGETKIRYMVAGSAVDSLVSHFSPTDWPEVKQTQGPEINLDDTFKQALREALECSSVDSSRYVLNGVCIDVTTDKNAHYIVGTDGKHLFAANSFRFSLPESLIVPSRRLITWPGFVNDGPWKLSMLPKIQDKKQETEEPAWFTITSEHWSYMAKAIDGKFPNWKQVLPTADASWTQINLESNAVDTILDALPMMPGVEEANQPVTLTAGNGLCLKAKGKNQDTWTRIPIPSASVVGRLVDTTVNRGFLLKALRFGLNRIQIHSALEPLVFTSERKTMVVMPLRGEPESEPTSATQESPPSQPESAVTPSAAEMNTPTEERKSMTTNTMTAPERGNLKAGNNTEDEHEENRSAFKSALEQIDSIKSSLRDIIGELSEAMKMLKAAEKEQRASAREIETFRAKLREIQSVEI